MSRKPLFVAVLLLFVGAAPFVLAPPGLDEDERPQIPPPSVEPVSVPRPDERGPAPAPEPTGITVRVRVIDESARALTGARVTIEHRDRLIDDRTTDEAGILFFRDIPPGYYTKIRATASGFVPVKSGMDDLDPRDAVLQLVRGVPMTGRVRAYGGKRPVAGADVSFHGNSTGYVSTKTAGDGTFCLVIPAGDLIDIEVDAGADGWVRLDEIIPAPGVPLRVVLPEVHEQAGRVVDGEGNPVAGVSIESRVGVGLVSIHGFCADGSRRDGLSDVTDAKGRFLLRGLTRPGTPEIGSEEWKLEDSEYGWPEGRDVVVARVVPPAPDEPSGGDARDTRPGCIRGRILVHGPKVAAVYARREVKRGNCEYHDWHTAWCRPDGSFEIRGLALADYDLSVSTVGHEDLLLGRVMATAEGCDVGVLRPPPLVRREGWVTTADGSPLASARAAGRPVGPDGRFVVEIDPALHRRISFAAPGYAPRNELPPETGAWVVVLTPVQVVEGIFLDVDGKPIPSVWMYARPSLEGNTKSDLAGRFRLTYRKPGKYSFLPSADGHKFTGHQDVRTGDRSVVIRAVTPCFVGGRVVDDVEMPIPSARVRIGKEKVKTDADGRFRMEGLLGHSFTVRVDLDGADLAIRPVNDVPPNTDDLVLRARRGQTVTGTIVYPDGRPAPELELYAVADGHAAPDRDSITDADGRFVLRGLLPGRWTVGSDLCDDDVEDAWWEGTLTGVRPGDRDVVLRLVWCAEEEEEED